MRRTTSAGTNGVQMQKRGLLMIVVRCHASRNIGPPRWCALAAA
jgi:hypothetical protein